MIILKSTHNRELEEITNNLMNRLNKQKLFIGELENRNCELNIKRVVAEQKSNNYQDWYRNLTFLYKDSQNTLQNLEEELNVIKREFASLEKKLNGYKKLHEDDSKEMKKLRVKMRSFAVDTYWAMLMKRSKTKSVRIKKKKDKQIDRFIIDTVMDQIHN